MFWSSQNQKVHRFPNTLPRDAGVTMSLLYWARKLYSLDTLDTRFTHSANPPRAVTESQSQSQSQPQLNQIGLSATTGQDGRPTDSVSQSRWKTPEFFFYYLAFIIVVPLMFKTVIDVSQGQYSKYQLHFSSFDFSVLSALSVESHPTYSSYSHLLSPGWIPGRKVVSLVSVLSIAHSVHRLTGPL
jgi:hypothetical protein